MINPKSFHLEFVVFISLNIEFYYFVKHYLCILKFLKCRPNLAFIQGGHCRFAVNVCVLRLFKK